MRKYFRTVAYLTLFGDICGLAGLIASLSGSTTMYASFGFVTSQATEGATLIAIAMDRYSAIIHPFRKKSSKQGTKASKR